MTGLGDGGNGSGGGKLDGRNGDGDGEAGGGCGAGGFADRRSVAGGRGERMGAGRCGGGRGGGGGERGRGRGGQGDWVGAGIGVGTDGCEGECGGCFRWRDGDSPGNGWDRDEDAGCGVGGGCGVNHGGAGVHAGGLPVNEDGAAAAAVAVEGPPPQIHFDVAKFQRCNGGVASTKVDLPADGDSIAYHCQPVFWIIHFAYTGTTAFTLTLGGYPDWVETELYNFEAQVAPEDVATWQKMSLNARRAAVRGLLANELKLKIKVDTTPKPVYTLTVATDGPKLKAYTEGEQEQLPNGLVLTGKDMTWVGRIAYFQDASMGSLAELLSAHLDRQVLNQTGLVGGYDFRLPLPHGTGTSANADLGEDMPSVAESLAELGLKLDAVKTEVDGLVVQHIERPAED
jgi:uncharacterized protein (TIGR03435 family)